MTHRDSIARSAHADLAGRTFVLGGASGGLGLAVARALSERGARMLLLARGQQLLAAASAELGGDAATLAVDLSAADAAERVAAAARERFAEGIDGLLVNAGGPPRGSVLTLDDDAWAGAWELLVAGPLRLVRALAPQLRPGAAMLFVASSSVREPVPGLATSNVLRPAVAALVRELARALAPAVRVNALAPGRFDTDRAREGDERRAVREAISPIEARRSSEAAIPLGRYGEPSELAQAAAFLLSPAASYVTGATLHVDGGLVSSAP